MQKLVFVASTVMAILKDGETDICAHARRRGLFQREDLWLWHGKRSIHQELDMIVSVAPLQWTVRV